jgi:hypothetical protein
MIDNNGRPNEKCYSKHLMNPYRENAQWVKVLEWKGLKQTFKHRAKSSKCIFICKVDIETALATKWLAICFTNKGGIYKDNNGTFFIFDFLGVYNSNQIEEINIDSIEGLNKPLPFFYYSSKSQTYTMLSLMQIGDSWYHYCSKSNENHERVIWREQNLICNEEIFEVKNDYLKNYLCKENGFIYKCIQFNNL